MIGILDFHTKYYWRVVEYNSFGQTVGPVWYFISQGTIYNYWDDDFNSGLSNYTLIQPPGADWSISNTSNAGGSSPELFFHNSAAFNDTSYLILNNFFDLSPSLNPIRFDYSVDWQSGEFIIGIAYSLDDGITWTPIWQQIVTEDIPASQMISFQIPNENYAKLALFCISTVPNSAGYWYIDNLALDTPLTVPRPPAQIRSAADTESQKVFLSWVPGYTVNPSWGYVIQRKIGLPTSSSAYEQIAWVGPDILFFDDTTVELDSTYTYRIQSREGPGGGFRSTWSNEATAYVPEVVPVELVSFTAEITANNVMLSWLTASEINNRGFEIEKRVLSSEYGVGRWERIGFVDGNGTTTETKFYSFTDENLQAGTYKYRLKQIDFDGTFEYSDIIEAEVGVPNQFALFQNYPNPFNPITKIRFSIPQTPLPLGKGLGVRLIIYDLLGREVATLVDEEKPAGYYEVEFSVGTFRDASGLSSGVYIYQLRAGNYFETKKMILSK